MRRDRRPNLGGTAIPNSVYKAIARATLPMSVKGGQIIAREAAVKQFIAANGGDKIYQTYRVEYGPPPDKRE